MDFSFSEEQTLLQDSVQRFIQNDYLFEDRQKISRTDLGFSRENWSTFAELGWLALPFSEDAGGFGGTAIETMIMLEEFGKGLVVEPYIPTIILAGGLIERGGSQAQKEGILAELMAGTKMGALAFVEPQARFNLADITTGAAKDGSEYVINGFKGVVIGGPSADVLIVPVRNQNLRSKM
jgi:alkylation response protein AidB-like acyl-CoA dehydrogenase